jgi:hypothetical protein
MPGAEPHKKKHASVKPMVVEQQRSDRPVVHFQPADVDNAAAMQDDFMNIESAQASSQL